MMVVKKSSVRQPWNPGSAAVSAGFKICSIRFRLAVLFVLLNSLPQKPSRYSYKKKSMYWKSTPAQPRRAAFCALVIWVVPVAVPVVCVVVVVFRLNIA